MLSLDAKDTVAGGPFPLKQGVSLANYTSYRVGGKAEWFALPKTPAQLTASVQWATCQNLPVTMLGAGSNLLLSDRGLPGLVICSRHLRGISFDDATGRLTVAGGEPLPNLAWKAARKGWRGLEWAVGVPGTVGGAVFMNAGAHGACTADSLVKAEGVTLTGEPISLSPEMLAFSYRTSSLQSQLYLVTQVTFQLSPGHCPEMVIADTQVGLDRRRSTQPYHLPSCGSVFRNPPPYTAGWLIEQTGLKGYQIGGVQVSTQHANFIVNLGNAKAEDVLSLIRYVQTQVEQQWSLRLHPEVRLMGDFEGKLL
ncbi:MAG: UDP-N-acetylmuramate dehydrogenase [Cyanobacteria bacterium P01_F01_bin.86]